MSCTPNRFYLRTAEYVALAAGALAMVLFIFAVTFILNVFASSARAAVDIEAAKVGASCASATFETVSAAPC